MTLISINPNTALIGWPSILGYCRVGAFSVLNLFGFKVTRIGKAWAVSVG